MKLPLSWLRDYVDVDLPPAEFAARVTDAIAEVEGWEVIGEHWDPELVRVAEVLAVDPHPNADRLVLATVNVGEGPRTVVCGAPNVAAGQKVAFATEGAMLVDGHTGKRSKLKLRAIRGVDSAGMVLSEKELGLSDDHEGILVLPGDCAIGASLVDAIGDVVFDVSTWANRADLLGILGFAREVAAVTGQPLREPDLGYAESGRPASDFVSVTIEAPDLCRRFTAGIVEGVEVGPSPPWMQQRLARAGMRPINNVVDVTNYVMLETGQPLHAFDYELVRGAEIRPRRARPGERLTTLDEVERDLDPEMLMICDGEGPVAVAGIMGGGNSEVSESTSRSSSKSPTSTPARSAAPRRSCGCVAKPRCGSRRASAPTSPPTPRRAPSTCSSRSRAAAPRRASSTSSPRPSRAPASPSPPPESSRCSASPSTPPRCAASSPPSASRSPATMRSTR